MGEIKKLYDSIRLERDVEKRTFEIQLANEADQNKKLQTLLKQNSASLAELERRHKELAELNKENEAKLFQTKIGV